MPKSQSSVVYPTIKIPKYRRQKRAGKSDLAFVLIQGKRKYLGAHGTPESQQQYHQLLAEYSANGGALPSAPQQITVTEVIALYWKHAEGYYRDASGNPTNEIGNIRLAMGPVRRLYGRSLAADFGPKALKAVRQTMIDHGNARKYINNHITRVKGMFKWAVGEELIPPAVYQGLSVVPGLKWGRSDAKETDQIRPVPLAYVNAVEPFVSRQVWAIIQLQLLCAARSGELVQMRLVDLDTSGENWIYSPQSHKTAYRGHSRHIYLGPKSQIILKAFMHDRPLEAYVFSPRQAEEERRSAQHAQRATPLSCGNRPGTNRKTEPQRTPSECYTTNSYRRAIARACEQAFPPPAHLQPCLLPTGKIETKRALMDRLSVKEIKELQDWKSEHSWHPHQLRHNAATEIRKKHGIEAAQLALGHKNMDVTQIYAEANHGKIQEFMVEHG